jgi:NADH:quinone reductase (non-electrogenic)
LPHSHVGESDITNFILLSRARQSLKVPFIASGGFADGQGLAAALCLGASGINMGTRFMCTVEAPIHENIKKEIVKASETDTALVLRRWTNTTRLYKNKVTEQALKVERESKTGEFAEIAPFVSGQRGRQVFVNGDPDYGVSDGPHPYFITPPPPPPQTKSQRLRMSIVPSTLCVDHADLSEIRSGLLDRSSA